MCDLIGYDKHGVLIAKLENLAFHKASETEHEIKNKSTPLPKNNIINLKSTGSN